MLKQPYFTVIILFVGLFTRALPSFAGAELMSFAESELMRKVSGTSYDLTKRDQKIYTIERTAVKSGDEITATNVFKNLEGKPAVTETMKYKAHKFSSFTIDYHESGEKRSARIDGDKVHFEHVTTSKTKTDDEELEERTLIPDQIVPYMQSNWEKLMKGEELTFYLVALTRLDLIKFKLKKAEEKTENGTPIVVIDMDPNSFIIAALVKTIHFTFKKDANHPFVKYEGRISPPKKVGSDWKDQDALNIY